MRRISLHQIVLLVGLILLAACAPPAEKPSDPNDGEEPEEVGEIAAGPRIYDGPQRPVYLWLEESGDPVVGTQATIHVFPPSASVHWTYAPGRVVWIVEGKREEDEWIIEWKGPDSGSGVDYWPGEDGEPAPKRIGAEHDAFFTGPPVGDPPAGGIDLETAVSRQATVAEAGTAVWEYEIRVERRMPEGNVETIAVLDPEIVILYP